MYSEALGSEQIPVVAAYNRHSYITSQVIIRTKMVHTEG